MVVVVLPSPENPWSSPSCLAVRWRRMLLLLLLLQSSVLRVVLALLGEEGEMRALNPDSDPMLTRPPVAGLPGGLDAAGVRLRLRLRRLGRRGDGARACWHLVTPGAQWGTGTGPAGGERPATSDPDPHARSASHGLMSISSSAAPDMQTTPGLGPQFMVGPPAKVPGRKRGRPPIRKLEFQHHYPEALSALKVPKKRGRKPGFKLKPRMLMSPLADSSPPSSTPEPEMSSIPQDAALVPRSATPHAHTSIQTGQTGAHVFLNDLNLFRPETSVPDDFLCDPVDSKRYAVDPSDSAFGVMATGFQPKHSYGYRGSSGCSNPMATIIQSQELPGRKQKR
ncbi:LOW QUALITY PROTEIN: hypothetical protein CRUP_011222 [Coryphaenoides rupestris]|nr:LOW QUALITY PROTEIN: hypothetical protein CRUP_011222 [Coryphaenoides rupestris]